MADWTEKEKREIWNKAAVASNNDPTLWRKDQCGAWIYWDAYGDRDSEYGWEIDHIKPDSLGGLDIVSNTRPLQWQNNASRQNGRLSCPIVAEGVKNVKK